MLNKTQIPCPTYSYESKSMRVRPGDAHLIKLPRDAEHAWRSTECLEKGRVPLEKGGVQGRSSGVCGFLQQRQLRIEWEQMDNKRAFSWAETGKDGNKKYESARSKCPEFSQRWFQHHRGAGKVRERTWLPEHLLPNWDGGPTNRVLL